jgi:hypothetical protein
MDKKQVIIPIAILILISSCIGFAFQAFFGGFWQAALAGLLGQLLVYNVYTSLLELSQKRNEIKNTLDTIIEAQTCPIACPCGKNVVQAPLFINNDNDFICEVCNAKFRVEITYESILQTQPTNLSNIFDVLKQKELEQKEL